MTVRTGLLENSASKILEEIVSILIRLELALGDNRKPIPPTVALIEFFVADEVTS